MIVITEFDCIKKYVFLKNELANFYKNKAPNVLVKLNANDKKQRRQPSVSQQRFFGERQTTTKKMEKCFFLQKKTGTRINKKMANFLEKKSSETLRY